MKKIIATISLVLLLGSSFSASAQKNESWEDRSPYEITIGSNLGAKHFWYDGYNISENENLSLTNILQTPSVNVGFTYKLNKRITLGAIATYAQSNFVLTALYDNAVVNSDRCTYMSIAPRIRFDWLNRRNVTLYSSFALGIGMVSERDRINKRSRSYTSGYVEATYLGIKVGRALFGFADLSSSSSGAMRVGIGYNFKSKK